MRTVSIALASLLMLAGLQATTLQQLSLDEMVHKSTAVVRAKITGSRTAYRGPDLYTYYQVQVLDTWKGSGQTIGEVAVPGGAMAGRREVVAGAPTLTAGEEYVLFLWTSRSGLTQLMGLSQGLFSVKTNASGGTSVLRSAPAEPVVDEAGRPVQEGALSLGLAELRARVLKAKGAAQ
jgi:hypothetical protein